MATGPKRVKHLSRYVGILGVLFFLGYWYTDYSYQFLPTLAPSFFIVFFLRRYGAVVLNFLPNEAVINKFALLLPISIAYFGVIGYHVKNILNERGKIRVLILLAFFGFLGYVHYLAFQELDLYWQGSDKVSKASMPSPATSTNPSPNPNPPLGNDQGKGLVEGSSQ